MEKEGVGMALPIAIVEDQTPDARRLRRALRFGEDCIEILDGICLPVRQKDKCALPARFTQYQFRHMRQELH